MDESTRRQFRRDLKDGHSPDSAGSRAGIGRETAYYEADRAKGEAFSRFAQSMLTTAKPQGEIPFGAIGFVILCLVVASYAATILKMILFAGVLALMLASLVTTFMGMWTLVQLVWLTAGSAAIGAVIHGLRDATAGQAIFGLPLPELATGAAFTDAWALGFCAAMTVFAVPALRNRLFRWMSARGLTQALRVYVAADFSNLPLRALALAFLLPLAAALFWGLLIWPGAGWALRVIFGYGLVLVAAGLLWVWRLTIDPGFFGTYFGVVDVEAYRAAWDRYGRA